VVATLLFIAQPWIHHLTSKWTWDRAIGEFSYPVYLWHVVIGYYFGPAQTLWSGYFLLLLSVLASAPLVLVERPIGLWRERSLRDAKQGFTPALSPVRSQPLTQIHAAQRGVPHVPRGSPAGVGKLIMHFIDSAWPTPACGGTKPRNDHIR
jgi:peptidoglycan/LPS O-acetylase OafA/YrhL